MKFFKAKKIQIKDIDVDYYEWNKQYVYKLDFIDGNGITDWLLFSSEESLKNYVIYHQIKDYTCELVEVISNNLRFL